MFPSINHQTITKRGSKYYSFEELEARQLLAATGLAQWDGDTSVRSSLVVNGTFDVPNDELDSYRTMEQELVTGWSLVEPDLQSRFKFFTFNGRPRGEVLELDSTAERFDRVFQSLNTEPSESYLLTFDLRARPAYADADLATNDVEVLWDGSSLGVFRGDDFWQTIALEVQGSADFVSELEVREIQGAANDGHGPFLDNFRVVNVEDIGIDNGSFESGELGSNDSDSEFPGWGSVGTGGSLVLDLLAGVDAADGSRYVNLDSSAEHVDRIYQVVQTTPGSKYFLTFDLKAESGDADFSEELRVRWADQWAGTFRGAAQWQSFGLTLDATSDSERLVLREPGSGANSAGDGRGPLLDNVRLYEIKGDFGLQISVDTVALLNVQENALPMEIVPGLHIDSQGVGALSGARIQISSNSDRDYEMLSATTAGTQISASFDKDSGVLSLIGDGSISEYETVLRSTTYENQSEDPASQIRNISFSVFTDETISPLSTINLAVEPINDPPVLQPITDTTALVNVDFEFVISVNDPDDSVSELTFGLQYTGDAIQQGDNEPVVDQNGLIRWLPSRTGELQLTVTATDAENLAEQRTFTITVDESQSVEVGTVTILSGSKLPSFDNPDPAIGQQLPRFEAQQFDGSSVLIQPDGVSRIFGFFAHWCGVCQSELPEFSDWYAQTSLPANIEVVAASVSVFPDATNYPPSIWFADEGFSGRVIVDDDETTLQEIFGVDGYPFWVAVDGEGRVVERVRGAIGVSDLNRLVDELR